jgi:hypothetical protein
MGLRASVARMKPLKGLLRAWNDAEARGDPAALDALLADDFRGDGPEGFVLEKESWLDRHRRGDLTVDSAVRRDGRWRIVNVQLGERTF